MTHTPDPVTPPPASTEDGTPVPDPVAALARAHELGEPVLVTGSLYLLADLAAHRPAGVP